MIEDLTMELFREYYEKDRLGYLSSSDIPIRPYEHEEDVLEGQVFINLTKFYQQLVEIGDEHESLSPDNMLSIIVFGSVLHRHFETPYDWRISDLDISCILRGNVAKTEKIIMPETEKAEDRYGGTYNKIVDYIVGTETPARIDRNFFEVLFNDPRHTFVSGAIPLHLDYRPIDQLLHDIERDDDLQVNESLVRYGVPLVNKSEYEQAVSASPLQRTLLHRIEWEETEEGILYGKIV